MKLSKAKLFIASLLIMVGVFFIGAKLFASGGSNTYGYLWSSNIGWIDMNDCGNPADVTTCNPSGSYGVSVLPAAPGTMSGYAWSSNIGWITFNDSGCPTTGCVSGARATWNSDGSATIKGWARACSVYASGCSGGLKSNAYLGTWDGYIALDSVTAGGTGGTWGMTISTSKKLGGYAWGSNVIGWITSVNASIYSGGPTVTLTATPANINLGEGATGPTSSVLKAVAANIGDANSCVITSAPASTVPKLTMAGSGASWNGSITVSPTVTTVYTVSCTQGAQVAKAQATVTVTYFGVPPVVPPTNPPTGGGCTGSCPPPTGGGYCTDGDPQFTWNTDAPSCTITRAGDATHQPVSHPVPGSTEDTTTAFGATLSQGTDGRNYYTDTLLPMIGTGTTYTLQCTGGSVPININLPVASCSNTPVTPPGNPGGTQTPQGSQSSGTKPPIFKEF